MGRGDLSIRKAAVGGAGLTYWQESQGTISGVLKDSWIPRAEGSNTVNDPWIPVANVAPSIYTSAVSYFAGPFVAGRYRVNYVSGALQYYAGGGLWGLNAGAPYGFRVVHSGGAAVVEGPYTTYTEQASQAEVEAANAGAYVEFDHAGGTIGMYLQDAPYGDNAPGTPNPTFELVGLPMLVDAPVHGIIASRGGGGMVISDGISTLPTPVLGAMTLRWAGGYDFQGGNAAFAGRVSGANPETDQDFVTKAWLSTRYFGFTAWTPSSGAYLGRTFSKWAPNSDVLNVDVVIEPKGNGALTAQSADGAMTGGNLRGIYSTDFQRNRASVAAVASGPYATLSGGYNNEVSGDYAAIGGGSTNRVTGYYGVISGGGANVVDGANAVVSGGSQNSAAGQFAVVCGGSLNSAAAASSVIIGGVGNVTGDISAVVLGGEGNTANGLNSIVGGKNALATHSGAMVISSLGSGGAASASADQCTLNFASGYRFQGGSITEGIWRGTTVGVDWGGTGVSSFTKYAVVCGGAGSPTDPLQTVAGLGSAGQVLTSNGAAALPTWQNASVGLTYGKLHAVNSGIGF